MKTDNITFAANDYVEVVCIYVPDLANGVIMQTKEYDSGCLTSDPGATLAHGLPDKYAIASYVVLQKNTSTGALSLIEQGSPVQSWDSTNINVDFSGHSFTGTEYRILTSPVGLAVSRAVQGNVFEFTATGVLGAGSTSYVCDKMFSDSPSLIRAVQKTGSGWQNIDNIGALVWVTADANKYLQGNIDSLSPSVANPVRIIVE